MRTRNVVALAVVLALAVAIGAAGAMAAAERVQITFTYWGTPEMEQAFQKLIAEFEQEYPNISVNPIRVPSKYYDKLTTMIAGGTAPDVAMLAFDRVPQFVDAGALQPIDAFVAKYGYPTQDLFPVVVEAFTYGGKLYGLPRSFSPFVMYYNEAIFREKGIQASNDWTWAQFLDAAMKTTTFRPGGPWGFAANFQPDGVFYPEWLFPFIWQNGGDVIDPKTLTSRLSEPATKDAMAFYVDLIAKHKVAPNGVQAETYGGSDALFLAGRAAMIQESYVLISSARSQAKLEFDVMELPHQKTKASVAFPIGYVMPAAAPHPEEAWKFLAYLGGPEGQKLTPELGLGVPGLMSIGLTDLFLQPGKQPEHAAVFLEQSKTARLLPNRVPRFQQWYDAWRQEIATVMTGAESLEQALPRIDAAVTKAAQGR